MTGAVPASVTSRMRSNTRRDTAPELRLRRALHARGLRFRLDRRVIPGPRNRIDIVFGPSKVAVEVYGCFWHACPLHRTSPRTNGGAWQRKLAANVARDRNVRAALEDAGWWVEVVWEHEDPEMAASRIAGAVRSRRPVDRHHRRASQ